MSDADLRTLDRRARLTGSDEDLAAWLRVLLRVGDGPCGECQGTRYVGPLAPAMENPTERNVREMSQQMVREMAARGDLAGASQLMELLTRQAMLSASARFVAQACPRCAGTGLRLRPYAELCAYAGAPWAREAVPEEPGEFSLANAQRCPHDPGLRGGDYPCPKEPCMARWVSGLSRWGREVQVRAAVAAGQVALAVAEDHEHMLWDERWSDDTRTSRRALEAAEAWLACPCFTHGENCLAHHEALQDEAPSPWGLLLSAICSAQGIVWHDGPQHARFSAEDLAYDVGRCVDHCARLTSPEAVRSAISRSLVEWSLGVMRG